MYAIKRFNDRVVRSFKSSRETISREGSTSVFVIPLKLYIVHIHLLQVPTGPALVAYTHFLRLNIVFLIFQLNIEQVSTGEF